MSITSHWYLWAFSLIFFSVLIFWVTDHLRKDNFPLFIKHLVLVLRVLACFLFLLICLDLSVDYSQTKSVKSKVAIIWDNSQSMLSADSSSVWRKIFLNSRLYETLRQQATVDHYVGYGSEIITNDRQIRHMDFSESMTDLGRQLEVAAQDKDLAYAVLISDGQSYVGQDIEKLRLNMTCPLLTVGIGEESVTDHPHVVSLDVIQPEKEGDSAQVLLKLGNHTRDVLVSELELLVDDSVIYKNELTLGANRYKKIQIPFFQPNEGLHTVTLQSANGNTVLKSSSFLVDDPSYLIVVQADPPDADLAAMVQVLREAGYSVMWQEDWQASAEKRDPDLFIDLIYDDSTPKQREIAHIELMRPEGVWEKTQLQVPESFKRLFMFELDPEKNRSAWRQLPPCYVGDHVSASGEALLLDQAGRTLCEKLSPDHIRIWAKGLWMWRTAAYEQDFYGLYEHFIKELVLDLLENNGKALEFKSDIISAYPNEEAVAALQLMTGSITGSAGVLGVSIFSEDGRELWRQEKDLNDLSYFYVSAEAAGTYLLRADLSYKARETAVDTAYLHVEQSNYESIYRGCNSQSLSVLAANHNGNMLPVDQVDQWVEQLKFKQQWKHVQKHVQIRDLWFIYVIIFCCLVSEWIIRKHHGSI